MGSTWVLSAPGGPHVGLMNLAIRGVFYITITLRYCEHTHDFGDDDKQVRNEISNYKSYISLKIQYGDVIMSTIMS